MAKKLSEKEGTKSKWLKVIIEPPDLYLSILQIATVLKPNCLQSIWIIGQDFITLINFLQREKIVEIFDFHSLIQTLASATYHLTQILQNISKDYPHLSLKTIFGRFDSGKQNHAFFINISCTKFQICWLIFALFPESWNLLEVFSSEVALSSRLSTYSGDPHWLCCKPQCSL